MSAFGFPPPNNPGLRLRAGSLTPPDSLLVAYNGYNSDPGGNLRYSNGYGIGLAYSGDCGKHFYRMPGNPVLVVAGAGWDSYNIKDPCLLKDGRTWHLYYSGQIVGQTWQIGHATSTDGVTYTKDPANPVLALGGGGAWDSTNVYFPFVLIDPLTGIWHLWYSGNNAAAGDTTRGSIGHATSVDGYTWTKDTRNPLLTAQAGEQGFVMGCVYKDPLGSQWYMFWQTFATGAATSVFSLATSTDGATWVRRADILSARSTAVQSPSANIALGAQSVTVPNSAVFTIGEPVYVEDSANWETNYVSALPDATHVSLRNPTVNAYTTAASALLASVYSGKQTPRSIIQDNNGFVLFGTVYAGGQAQGGTYHEDAGAWSAPAPAGPWSHDMARGVVIDKTGSSGGTANAWDTSAAENLSVVPAAGVSRVLAAAQTGPRMRQVVKRTAGDLSPTQASTATWAPLNSPGPPGQGLDGWLAAQTGDLIRISLNGKVYDTGASGMYLDFVIVTYPGGIGTLGNWVGCAGGAADQGIPGWRVESGVAASLNGSVLYTAKAADIYAGSISLRLQYRMSVINTGRVIGAQTVLPLFVIYENLGGIGY